jgi:hypothetical protein
MSAKLTTTFQNAFGPPPGPHENASNANTVECVNQPSDTSVLSEKFYEEQLKHSPAALASPMGTAIPGIGHGFNNKGDR